MTGGGRRVLPEHRGAPHRTLQYAAVLAVLSLGVLGLISTGVGLDRVALMLKPTVVAAPIRLQAQTNDAATNVASIQAQTRRINAMNARLEHEDKLLARKEKEDEGVIVARVAASKSRQLAKERARDARLQRQKAELLLKNAELKEKLLEAQLATKRARINKLKKLVRSNTLPAQATLTAIKRDVRRQMVRARAHAHRVKVRTPADVEHVEIVRHKTQVPAVSGPLGRLATINSAHSVNTQPSKATQSLVGSYVKACKPGQGCHVAYLPETEEHWDEERHTEQVMESGLPLPIGPTRRVPVDVKGGGDLLAKPLTDTLRPEQEHTIYGVYTGTFLGPHDPDFADNFVPIKHTALSADKTAAPWDKEHGVHSGLHVAFGDEAAGDEEGEEDEEGLETVQGFNGTHHDVYEAMPLSGAEHFDWKKALLKHAGVNVDGVEALKEPHHEWDADGKDHYNETHPEPEHEVDWSKLDSPQWAWNNQAMKSQGWEPEGKENKDLMLGTTWDAKHPAPFVGGFADTFVKKDDYNKQIEPRNVQERDHFGNWGPEEAKNRRLLYGNTGSFEYRVKGDGSKDSDWTRNSWDLTDEEHGKEIAAHELGVRSEFHRTGEPVHDAMTGWPMTNFVGAGVNNVQGDFDEGFSNAENEATPPLALEKHGVKVAAYTNADLLGEEKGAQDADDGDADAEDAPPPEEKTVGAGRLTDLLQSHAHSETAEQAKGEAYLEQEQQKLAALEQKRKRELQQHMAKQHAESAQEAAKLAAEKQQGLEEKHMQEVKKNQLLQMHKANRNMHKQQKHA